VSEVSAESWTLLEDFAARRALGVEAGLDEMAARRADGLAVLAAEWEKLERTQDG
jgi:hypothetical protein